ncbi:hypothetical protein OS189_08215 [Sulfitobacter sp. F26169L]|uniref:hypothetical protein n=1 Tax=Sulfitobacter sp. F26169L TaxID=2996015 RepID=UPI002260D1F8|nr:hypothetical protein [Sulfitobacter sp. F26169L]MCX7566326.1 hypothetical protein [Sulfitobacter sp. F26169L]
MVYLLVAVLAVWMFGCGYAGYHKRFGLFVLIVAVGMGLNTLWMVFGLDAKPLSPPALAAHLASLMYAISAVGVGWLLGRLVRGFRSSKVDAS